MAIAAICVQCGKPKKDALRPCKACGFAPETDYQCARALILSATRTISGVTVGRDAATLEKLSAQIQAGRFYQFDPQEEQRALEVYRLFSAERDAERARRMTIAGIVWATIAAAAGLAAYVALRQYL